MDNSTNVAAAHSRATLITGVTIAFLTTAWLAVLARTYVRAVMIRNYGWDDGMMLLAVIIYTLCAAFNLLLVSWGFGNPSLVLEKPAFISKVASYILVAFSLHAATMVALKISLGIFYLRIVVKRWQQFTIYTAVGIATLYGSYYFFALLFSCGLPKDFLSYALQDKCVGTTASRFAVNLTAGIVNALSDFVLAILPISLIRQASIPVPAKISAGMVLLMGCIGGAASVVRLAYIGGMTYDLRFFDVGTKITVWSIIEAGLCITAASLATLRPLCRCCIGSTRRTFTASPSPFSTEQSDQSKKQRSSFLRLKNQGPAANEEQDWPLKKPEATVQLDDMRSPTTSHPDIGITRKASLLHGKLTWLDSEDAEPRQASRNLSRKQSSPSGKPEGHPAPKHKAATSTNRYTYDPAIQTLSKPAVSQHPNIPGRARNGSRDMLKMQHTDQPKMEEVGVGAWRVCEEKRSRGGSLGRL